MIYGILLAAGSSQRFGADKLLYPLPEGVLISLAAARNLAAGVDRVIAVVRSGADRLAELLSAEGAEVLVCSDADQGMGASLACGVRSAPEAEGWLVALADMPFIRPATVGQIAALIRRGTDLAVPIYRGRRGHPVGFSRIFGRLLGQLEGDIGARQLLRSYAEHLTLLPCDDPGVLLDIDVPGDLAASTTHCRRAVVP